jgi:hypothetical protein
MFRSWCRCFYSTLGNTGYYDTSGVLTGCAGPPNYCLTNDGPFSNLQPDRYWSGTAYGPSTSYAWGFSFYTGNQDRGTKSVALYAWAVRPGDIAPVPVPGAAWLFGGALGLLGAARRRAMTALG